MVKLRLKPDPAAESPAVSTPGDTEKQEFEHESTASSPGGIKLSLNIGGKATNSGPRIRVKTRTAPEGYDTEAPDKEDDPVQEEAILFRMLPKDGLSKLKSKCEANNFEGFNVTFQDARHAVVKLDDEMFGAVLVDLPTITEASKTFDRKNIYKSADICQVLLVTKKIKTEEEALRIEPSELPWPHGITPPLRYAKRRRFHQRLSNKVIESLEAKVEDLLKKDTEAKEVHTEILPASAVAAQEALSQAQQQQRQPSLGDSTPMQDSESEEDDIMELEKALEEGLGDNNEEPEPEQSESESEDESDSDDEEDEEGKGARQHVKQLHEEIHELESTLEQKQRAVGQVVNDIMRARHMDAVNRLIAEIDKKRNILNESTVPDEPAKQDKSEEEEEEEEEEDDDDDEEMADAIEAAALPPALQQQASGTHPAETEMGHPQTETEPETQSQPHDEQQPAASEPQDEHVDDDIDSLF